MVPYFVVSQIVSKGVSAIVSTLVCVTRRTSYSRRNKDKDLKTKMFVRTAQAWQRFERGTC